jgi:hypothetical protein
LAKPKTKTKPVHKVLSEKPREKFIYVKLRI